METNDTKKDDVEVEEVEEIVETLDEDDNDVTDWKALALKNQGIAKRFRTKLLKKEEVKVSDKEPEKSQDKTEFDYAEKAFLKSSEIKPTEFPFVLEVMQNTGKSLEEVLENKYFQNELNEKRELEASAKAIPEGIPRGGGAVRDTVEYWIAKGELPPKDQEELRRKVVNEKIRMKKEGSKFSDYPVIG